MISQIAKRICRIQYASDLHLEFHNKTHVGDILKPVSHYLALAGNIGKPGDAAYESFLTYVSYNWKHVFYVAGNLEYCDSKKPYDELHQELIHITQKYQNIHFLRHEAPSYYLAEERIAFVGSTLWTPNHSRFLGKLHEHEKYMLGLQIAYWDTQKTDVVAMTHHMPSFSLISPRSTGSHLASSCDSLMQQHVKAWIYGIRNTSSGIFGSTFVACNARGYPTAHGYQNDRYFEIKPTDYEGDTISPELSAAALGIRIPGVC